LISAEIVVEFRVHPGLPVGVGCLTRLLQSLHEKRATIMSPDFGW
jgi:hypothetical protein